MTTAWRESKTAGGGSTDDITNASGVSGTTASDALDTLASNLVAEASARAAADLLLAPLASPVFTGNPRGPTPTLGDNDTSLATTAFVAAAITAAPATWGGITGTLSNQTDLQSALAAKAPLASPALTGTPTAPTAAPGTSTTQIATTAFVAETVKLFRFTVTIADIVNDGYVNVPAPGAGTVVSFRIASNVQPTVGSLVITVSQNGIGYTSATLTTSDSPNVIADSGPVNAAFADGAVIEWEISGANMSIGVCTVMVTYLLD